MRVLSWPSQSLDLNPIEHLWETLDCQVRNHRYSIKATCINQLIESIPHCCVAVISAKGTATKYYLKNLI